MSVDGIKTQQELRAQVLDLRCELRAMRHLNPSARFRSLFGKWELDLVSNRLTWSEETYRIFGIPRDTVDLYDAFLEAVHPEDREILRQASRAAMFKRQPYIISHRIVLPGGEVRQVFESAEVLYDLETRAPIRMLGSVVDLTERYALEEDRRHANRLEAIGELAGGVAHDFNNLLTVIMLTTSTILPELDPATSLAADIRTIQHATARGATLAGKLLSLARKQPLKLTQTTLGEVLGGLKTLLQGLVRSDVQLEIDTDSAAVLRVDVIHIEQALLNLCLNGLEAMPDGGTLRVTWEPGQVQAEELSMVEGSYVRVDVEDTGVGMSSQVMSKVFQAFYTTKPTGTGLGLPTAYGIVHQHHGDIRVRSQIGLGTCFSVFLPQLPEPDEIFGAGGMHVSPLSGRARVLFAEDDDLLRKLSAQVLQGAGYAVRAVCNGQDAVDTFARRPMSYDIVVLDAIMPALSGVEAYQRIRAIRPEIPVLFCSGYSEELVGGEILRQPRVSFLPKPFEFGALLLAVKVGLGAHA